MKVLKGDMRQEENLFSELHLQGSGSCREGWTRVGIMQHRICAAVPSLLLCFGPLTPSLPCTNSRHHQKTVCQTPANLGSPMPRPPQPQRPILWNFKNTLNISQSANTALPDLIAISQYHKWWCTYYAVKCETVGK